MSMKRIALASLLLLILISAPSTLFAKIGVGVGTGKIHVEDKLKPGTIYELPSLTVFNTGDVTSDYGVNVAYHEKQKQLKPDASWFSFSPSSFELKPGKSQEVKIKLNLPVMTEPGDYFAYLEGYPKVKSVNGKTTVGVAAAAKLYFTIIPGNVFEGIYFKAISFWNVYAPWPKRAVMAVGILALLAVLRKFFNIEIGLKKPSKSSEGHSHVRKENPENE